MGWLKGHWGQVPGQRWPGAQGRGRGSCPLWSRQERFALSLVVYSLSSRVRLFCNPMDCSPPGSSVHGIVRARILEWGAMPSSRGSSRPRDQTHVSLHLCIISSVQFSYSVVCNSLRPHEPQQARPPCPSPTLGAYPNSIESVMPSNHLILCHPLLLLPSIFPSIRVFSNESAL